MSNPSSALRRGAAALVTAGLSALMLSACGGSEPAANGASSSDNDRDTARLKLEQCLRDNGVEVPAPPTSGGSGPQRVRIGGEKVRAAMEGPCKKYREAAFGNISEADRQEFEDAFAKFAQCMRDNGVDVPDITAGGGPAQRGTRIDREDPEVRAAQEKCQDKLPRDGPGGVRIGPGAR